MMDNKKIKDSYKGTYIASKKFKNVKNKNICMISYNARSTNSMFNLSRWEIKRVLNFNNFNNIRKSSW
jgi:ribosomal protein S14